MSSIAIVEICGRSVFGAQLVAGVQQFVVAQMPPPSEPKYALIDPGVVVVGSTAIVFTRPDAGGNLKQTPLQVVLSSGAGPRAVADVVLSARGDFDLGARAVPAGRPSATRESC